jgi:hypothetical protein
MSAIMLGITATLLASGQPASVDPAQLVIDAIWRNGGKVKRIGTVGPESSKEPEPV